MIRILRGRERQARIKEQLDLHKYLEEKKLRQAEMIRKHKEERAMEQIDINKRMRQAFFEQEERQWAEKQGYIHNLKDMEEFRRGMTTASLEEKETRFRKWL